MPHGQWISDPPPTQRGSPIVERLAAATVRIPVHSVDFGSSGAVQAGAVPDQARSPKSIRRASVLRSSLRSTIRSI